jgi:hypothetical protein
MDLPRHGTSRSIKEPAHIPAPLTASLQYTVSAYSAQTLSASPARPNPSLKSRLSTAGRLARATALVDHRPHGQGGLPRPAA